MPARYCLLGQIAVVNDNAEATLDSAMVRALFAVLLLSPNQFVPVDRIITLLWERPPKSVSANLRKYATLLRRSFEAVSPGLGARLESRRSIGYRLLAEPGEIDLEQFNRLARQGQSDLALGRHAQAAETLQAALRLWRGPAGYDLPQHSLVARQVLALNEQRLAVATDLIEARLCLGEMAGLVAELRAMTATDPLNERAWEQLIRALHASGSPATALAAYTEARTAIRAQLGIEPSDRLRSLQSAMLRGLDLGAAEPATVGHGPG
jgi:DNA-binding SARP family transcriptional activator